jgi:tetratricopeptide (TPR) repeat protein
LLAAALNGPPGWNGAHSPGALADAIQASAAPQNLEPDSTRRAAASSQDLQGPQAEAAALKRETVAIARQVADAYPNDALAYALLGSAHYNTGQSEEATKYLRKCLELSPDQAEAYDILARVAYEKGQLEESVRLCREALKRSPGHPEVLNRLGRTLMDLGQTTEAIRTLQEAIRLPQPASESHYLLGQTYLQAGRFAQAQQCFQQAIAQTPDHTQAYFGLYTASLRLGQTNEANRYRVQFQKLEAVDRRSLTDRNAQDDILSGLPLVRKTVARTMFGAAQIHRVHGQAVQAAELYRRAASLDADSPLYRAALEAHYLKNNALPEAVRVFEQLVREQPLSSVNHLYLGRLQGRLDHVPEAEQAFRKAQELAPQRPEGYRALAELYLRTNRKLAEACLLARKTVELEASAPHYYLLAVACQMNGDRTGAGEAIQQALSLSPGEKRYQEFLQQLKGAP